MEPPADPGDVAQVRLTEEREDVNKHFRGEDLLEVGDSWGGGGEGRGRGGEGRGGEGRGGEGGGEGGGAGEGGVWCDREYQL